MQKQILEKHKVPLVTAGIYFLSAYPTFKIMWDRWFSADSYYSHGILIPFVVGYLIWNKKDELARIKPNSSPWGLWLIVLGVIIQLFSSVFRVNFTASFSLLPIAWGFVLHFYGKETFKKIFFPLSFLFFMLPLPGVVIVNVSFRMKLFAAEIARGVLNNMGIAAVRFGSIIRMQNAQVVVDDVCSGLRSLISLLALGCLFGYLMKGRVWKKILVVLSTVPIAVITNVCRVVFLASISEIWGAQYATGFVHDASGFLVFALAFGLLFIVVKILE